MSPPNIVNCSPGFHFCVGSNWPNETWATVNQNYRIDRLVVNRVGLTSFPSEISLLQELTYLLDRINCVQTINFDTNSHCVHIGHNSLTEVPTDLALLKILGDLKVNNNLLSSLPTELAMLESLTHLVIG